MKCSNQTKKYRIARRAVIIGCAAAAFIGTAAASAAYWTDRIEVNQKLSAYNLAISYDSQALAMNSTEPFCPGETKDFSFTVVNTGELSVDIRPRLVITSAEPMKKGGGEYYLVDSDGDAVDGYTIHYYNGQTEVTGEAAENGSSFTRAEYTLSSDEVLSGSAQAETGEGGSTAAASEKFSYGLKLSEAAGNSFMGKGVSLDISTYAIQHRNRAADESGSETGWISIAEAAVPAGTGT